jgi:hypothetical protein
LWQGAVSGYNPGMKPPVAVLHIVFCALGLSTVQAVAAGQAESSPKRTPDEPSVDLVVDYLPALIDAQGEQLTVVLRLVSEAREAKPVKVVWEVDGTAESEQSHQLAAGATVRLEHRLPARDWPRARAVIDIGDEQRTLTIRALSSSAPLPKEVRAEGRHLRVGDDYLVLRVPQKKGESRRWKTARVIYQQFNRREWPTSLLLLGSPYAAIRDGEVAKPNLFDTTLSPALRKLGIPHHVHAVPARSEQATWPVLHLIAHTDAALREMKQMPEAAVLVLPGDDALLATQRRAYELAVNAVLDRLHAAGVMRLTVVAPATPGVPDKQLATYVERARKAAHSRRAMLVELSRVLDEEHWELDRQVLGRYPNASGLSAAAAAIVEVLR